MQAPEPRDRQQPDHEVGDEVGGRDAVGASVLIDAGAIGNRPVPKVLHRLAAEDHGEHETNPPGNVQKSCGDGSHFEVARREYAIVEEEDRQFCHSDRTGENQLCRYIILMVSALGIGYRYTRSECTLAKPAIWERLSVTTCLPNPR